MSLYWILHLIKCFQLGNRLTVQLLGIFYHFLVDVVESQVTSDQKMPAVWRFNIGPCAAMIIVWSSCWLLWQVKDVHKWLLTQPGLVVSGSSIFHLLTGYNFIFTVSCVNFSSATLRYKVPHYSLSDSCCIDGGLLISKPSEWRVWKLHCYLFPKRLCVLRVSATQSKIQVKKNKWILLILVCITCRWFCSSTS